MKKTRNKILITGAGTGMGLAAAQFFHQQGDEVVMVARNKDRLREVCQKLGSGAYYYACDLADKKQMDELIRYIQENHTDLNRAFLNAGIAYHYSLLGEEDAYEVSQREMMVNYHATVFLTHALEPILNNKTDAAMIITTSGVAFAPDLLHPTYSATKAALHNYIVGLRLVLERKGSTVKLFELMAPLVDSPFSKAVTSDLKVPPKDVILNMVEAMKNNTYEIRPGLTEEIYQVFRKSPEEALRMVNAATGY